MGEGSSLPEGLILRALLSCPKTLIPYSAQGCVGVLSIPDSGSSSRFAGGTPFLPLRT